MEEHTSPEDRLQARLRNLGIRVGQDTFNPREDEWYAQLTKDDQQIEQIGPFPHQEIYLAILTWLIDHYEEAESALKRTFLDHRKWKQRFEIPVGEQKLALMLHAFLEQRGREGLTSDDEYDIHKMLKEAYELGLQKGLTQERQEPPDDDTPPGPFAQLLG